MNNAANDGVQWLITDHLGTPRLIADLTGSLSGMTRHDYGPFGEETGAGVGGRTTAQGYAQLDGVRQKWARLERDGETGLDYAKNRYYSSIQGRFTSIDPVKLTPARMLDPQQFNLYAYVRNNPLKFVDPDGKDIFLVNDTMEGRRKASLSITRNLTPTEQRNVGYRRNADGKHEMYIKDPGKIDLNKASQGYKDLVDRVGNHDLKLNFTFIEKGKSATIEINGVPTTVSHKALSGANGSDAGGFVSPQSDGSFAVVSVEGGYVPGVKGLTQSGRDTMIAQPDYILTAHELFAETYKYTPAGTKEGLQNNVIDDSNKVIEIENKYRDFHGLPRRSGKDHGYIKEEITVRP
jgi:RHS repeat-associated protein